jgi:hypothetical protein
MNRCIDLNTRNLGGQHMTRTSCTRITALALLFGACARNDQYEVIERTQREAPNFQSAGTHTKVEYVLLYEGHKIYATCDVKE